MNASLSHRFWRARCHRSMLAIGLEGFSTFGFSLAEQADLNQLLDLQDCLAKVWKMARLIDVCRFCKFADFLRKFHQHRLFSNRFLLNNWVWSGAKVRKSCRTWKCCKTWGSSRFEHVGFGPSLSSKLVPNVLLKTIYLSENSPTVCLYLHTSASIKQRTSPSKHAINDKVSCNAVWSSHSQLERGCQPRL